MKRLAAVCALVVIAACSASSTAAVASPKPSTAAVAMTGGCGQTQVYKGGEPYWLTLAGANNNPDFLPYFTTDPAIAAGFLFSYPLRSGPPSQPGNKILWVVGKPRNGAELQVTGHPLGEAQPTVQYSFPANSGPGEIYPSETDAPTPGCWHFDLSWGPNRAAVDLVYV